MFAATHSNVKTNLWSNIQYFNYIIFPAEKANHVNFRSITNAFRLGKESTEDFSLAFLEHCGKDPKAYIIFDVKSIAIYAANSLREMIEGSPNCYKKIGDLEGDVESTPDRDTLPEKDSTNYSQQFEKLIKGYKFKARASAAYSLLEKCVLKHFTMTPDLVVHIGGEAKKGMGKIKISIVDYIQFLIDPDTGTPPWKYITFHSFVCKKCHVPKLMVQNPSFQKALN